MNVCVFIWVVCLVLMAISMAFDYSQRMFWWSVVSFILYVIGGLFILDHVMLPFTWPFEFLVGEMKEPSIYISVGVGQI